MTEKKKIFIDLIPAFLWLVVIWIVFAVDEYTNVQLYRYGIFPRTLSGLKGIIFSPFIHGDLTHISNNSVPLGVLTFYLFHLYRPLAWRVMLYGWLFSGFWVWVSARESYHIGASSLIYALFGFLFVSGIIRKNLRQMGLSLLIVFLYGSMIWGIFPIEEKVSWEGHLCGMLAGLSLAIYYRKEAKVIRKYRWDDIGEEAYVDEAERKFGKYYWDPEKREKWLEEQRMKAQEEKEKNPLRIVYFFRKKDAKE